MKVIGWLGIGLVVSFMIAAAAFAIPGAVAGHPSLKETTTTPAMSPNQPAWNTGNLCTELTNPGPGDYTCVNLQSAAPVPLWWNFSAGEVQGGTVTVVIYGSADCINLNFHSFYTTIIIELYGSWYSCPAGISPSSVSNTPGVNIAINSEGDSFSLTQLGSYYATDVTIYGTTTYATTVMDGSFLNTTNTYIGTKPGFSVCPSGIVDGRVSWSTVSLGSFNTFNTVFVDGTNTHVAPPNYAYSTEALLPPDGIALGTGDLYGNETTQTAPAGSCAYLGV